MSGSSIRACSTSEFLKKKIENDASFLTNHSGTLLYLDPALFWRSALRDFKGVHAPVYCFLVSTASKHVIFDLGVRTDWHNYAPKVVSLIKATTVITPGTDVASVLDSDSSGLNIRSADILSIIWSHNHFDHIGDPSAFPARTELVVGPGVCAASWPGWPQNPDGGLLESDVNGRKVREIGFRDRDGLKIGRFDAFDFFGDQSFYLLDAPGHAVGHLCALARTKADPPEFVFMGADACHHPGMLRPSDNVTLPLNITLNAPENPNITSSGEQLPQHTTKNQEAINEPFLTLAPGPLFPDYHAAKETIAKIQELDAANNIFVLIAHDLSLKKAKIPVFPETINCWKDRNLKMETRWLFCGDVSNIE